MNTTSCELNNKKAIMILSIIALAFNLINDITYFITYEQNGKYAYEATFSFSSSGLFITLLSLAPYVLMILYIFKLRGSVAEAFTVPLLYISAAVSFCIDLVRFSNEILNVGTLLVTLAIFGLATISALNGLADKKYIIMSTVYAASKKIILLISSLISLKTYADNGWNSLIISSVSSTIALITLSIALLLFGLKNTAPSVLSIEKQDLNTLRPEQALKLLKDKFELGLITAEEYTTQRSHIIDSL